MKNDVKLLAEALHAELGFVKERLKQLDLLISKLIEQAAKNTNDDV